MLEILSLGYEFDHPSVTVSQFRSSLSTLDFDVVLWDVSSTLNEYTHYQTFQGLPSLSDDESARLLDDMKRREDEMKEMLSLGRTVMLHDITPTACYVATGEKEYSGTGRNQKVTRLLTNADLLQTSPIRLEAAKAQGENLELRADEPFASFWRSSKSILYYKGYLKKYPGTPFLYVQGTKRPVASVAAAGNGTFLALPAISIRDFYERVSDWRRAQKDFVDSLLDLIAALKVETGDFSLPQWTADYRLPEEEQLHNAVRKAEGRMKKVLDEISKQKEALARVEELKILFTGTGKALEAQVDKVFSALGCTVEEPDAGRTDRIIRWKDRVAVCEIKGVGKSGAEKHAAQLEKWVAGYLEEHGTPAKGILVVNGYRESPLNERSDPVFPDQMLGYSTRRGHCLITGIQMLGMYLEAQANPERTDDIVLPVFETEGLLRGHEQWLEFMSHVQQQPDVAQEVSESEGRG